MKRVLTGSRPSGSPHLGNYFGAFKPILDFQREHEVFFFLADFHAFNHQPDRQKLRDESFDMIATMVACGLDTAHTLLYSQSSVPEVAELAWYLSCYTSYGAMQRATTFKDAQAKGVDVNMGIFNYPILMTADILLYDADLVPVGQDQKQHLEIARDLAVRVNQRYEDLQPEGLFKVPDPLISEEVGLIPGSDGRKMSKSYDNVISVFATDKRWKEQVMAIKTDSAGLADPKNPDTCIVFQVYSLLAKAGEIAEMAERYRAGGYGYGHAKLALLEKMKLNFGGPRDRYLELLARPSDLLDILRDGSLKARAIARAKLEKVQDTFGFVGGSAVR